MRRRTIFCASQKHISYPIIEANSVPIIFHFSEFIGSQREIDDPRDISSYIEHRRDYLRRRTLEVHPSSNRTANLRDRIARLLYDDSVRLTEREQLRIIEELFRLLEDPVPELPIVVQVVKIRLRILDGNDDIIQSVPRESWETHSPNLNPATKSSIQGLEKVRLDSLEIKSIIELTPCCVICREGLDCSDDDAAAAAQEKEGIVDPDHKLGQIVITRMPCLHYYHQDCIVHWLEINHRCPICRYPMPTAPNPNPN